MNKTLAKIKLAKYESMGVFNTLQIEQIRLGLGFGLDVSIYADPKYTWEQMDEIRRGLESGVDVSIYADPKYNWKQMEQVHLKLEEAKDGEDSARNQISSI